MPDLVVTVLFSAAYVVYPVAWAVLLGYLFPEGGVRPTCVVLGSYALSLVLGLPGYAIDAYIYLRPIAAPAVVAICWCICRRCMCNSGASGLDGRSGSVLPVVSVSPVRPWFLYGMVLVVFLGSCVLVGFVKAGEARYFPDGTTLVRDVVNIAVALVLMATALCSGRLRQVSLVLVMGIVLVLMAGLVIASVSTDHMFGVGAALVATAESCLSVLLYLCANDLAATRTDVRRAMSVAFTLPCLANQAIGSVVIPGLTARAGFAYADFWGVLSVLAGLALGVVLIMFLTSLLVKHLGVVPDTRAADVRGDLGPTGLPAAYPATSLDMLRPNDQVAHDMAEAFHLSGREEDVLRLVLDGNTLKAIPQILGIGEGTVQTHTKNLYAKLDVHTKQGIVDLARAFRSRG